MNITGIIKGLKVAKNAGSNIADAVNRGQERKHGNVEKNAERSHEMDKMLLDYRSKFSSSSTFNAVAYPFIALLWIWFASPILKYIPWLGGLLEDYNALVNVIGGESLMLIVMSLLGIKKLGNAWQNGQLVSFAKKQVEVKVPTIPIITKNVGYDYGVLNCIRSLDNVKNFSAKFMDKCVQIEKETGLKARALLSQIAQESGWDGEATYVYVGSQKIHSNNFFNIKATDGWIKDGEKWGTVSGWEDLNGNGRFDQGEMVDGLKFRVYNSFEESAYDYIKLIKLKYPIAWKNRDNELVYFSELQKGGYATDGNYAKTLMEIAEKNWQYSSVS